MSEEIKDLIRLIERLEALREEFTLTYEGLHEVTGVMTSFAWETEVHHPLHKEKEVEG